MNSFEEIVNKLTLKVLTNIVRPRIFERKV